MPAMTPVLASGPPSSRARIRLRLRADDVLETPRMWTLNSSTLVPSNTVRPMPTMPGRISSTRHAAASPARRGQTAATPAGARLSAAASRHRRENRSSDVRDRSRLARRWIIATGVRRNAAAWLTRRARRLLSSQQFHVTGLRPFARSSCLRFAGDCDGGTGAYRSWWWYWAAPSEEALAWPDAATARARTKPLQPTG